MCLKSVAELETSHVKEVRKLDGRIQLSSSIIL